MTYLVPQAQPAVAKADTEVRSSAMPSFRATQKRWPMALSIWAAVAVSLVLWTGIVWIVSVFLGLFA